MRFKDRVVLITGGTRGIGLALSHAFAREGARLALLGRDPARTARVARDFNARGVLAIPVPGDVAVAADIDAAVQRTVREYERIDVLVNNAGICPFTDFFEVSEAEYDRIQAVNCKAIFLLCQKVGQVMRDHGGGSIVNVTSISGEIVTNVQQVAYCTSKAAANMLTKLLAVALAPYNIRVNAVLPGTIPTDINADVLATKGAKKSIEAATPLGCLGECEDITHPVLYLASDQAKWVTGTLLPVDGGYMINGTR